MKYFNWNRLVLMVQSTSTSPYIIPFSVTLERIPHFTGKAQDHCYFTLSLTGLPLASVFAAHFSLWAFSRCRCSTLLQAQSPSHTPGLWKTSWTWTQLPHLPSDSETPPCTAYSETAERNIKTERQEYFTLPDKFFLWYILYIGMKYLVGGRL